MDLPIEIIEVVKPTAKPKAKPKKRAPKFKKLPNRILQAVGSGLRTSTAIANALNVPKQRVQSSLWNLKIRGLIQATKQEGKTEYKYHLDTGEPVAKVAKVAKVVREPLRRETKEEVQLKIEKMQLVQRLSALEHTLIEKEKEIWTLECELFDKKAVITYLEGKLFALGVK